MRLEGSIDFSNQEFSVNSSTVPYKIAITGQIKKRSSVLRTRKILPTMMNETDIDNGGRPEAVVNEGDELKHSRLLDRPLKGMRDTMVVVPSSHGTIYKSCVLRK